MGTRIQHDTLVAATVLTVTLDQHYDRVEVVNVDGAAAVYVRTDGTNPTVEGDDCEVLPATIGGLTIPVRGYGASVVKLISSGTPKVSVRGIG